jgi:hypothetical protein
MKLFEDFILDGSETEGVQVLYVTNEYVIFDMMVQYVLCMPLQ